MPTILKPPPGRAYGIKGNTSNGVKQTPTFQKTKNVSYNSSNSDQIYSLATTTAATTPSETMPKAVEVENVGGVPLLVMAGYKTYSAEATIGDSGDSRYVHYMLMPGEVYSPPIGGVIMNADDNNVTARLNINYLFRLAYPLQHLLTY